MMIVDLKCPCGATLHVEYQTGNNVLDALVKVCQTWVEWHRMECRQRLIPCPHLPTTPKAKPK